RCMLERARRLVVIEGVDVAKPLIEELLRFRVLCGDRVMQVSQACHQSDRLALHGMGMILRERRNAQYEPEHDANATQHTDNLLDFENGSSFDPRPALSRLWLAYCMGCLFAIRGGQHGEG